jgi:glycine cleavage system protein P-like pyridoxal-binding family
VITIGLSEVEHNTIMIHFNGTRPKTMELDEFVALLESYDEEDTENDESSSSSSDDDDVGEMFQKQKSKSKKLESESKEIEEEQEGCTIS